MKKTLFAFAAAAALAYGQGGINLPVIGQVRDVQGRLIRISGVPGALQTRQVFKSRERLEPGWAVERTDQGIVLVNQESGERSIVPNVAADLKLAVFTPPSREDAVDSAYAFPETAVGAVSEVRFRIRNVGTAAVDINRVFIPPGSPIKTSNVFPIPRTLAPGGFGEFRVQFAPQSEGVFNAQLLVNDRAWTLTGSSISEGDLETYDGTAWKAVAAGATVTLGPVRTGEEADRWFRLTKPPATPPQVSGAGFTLYWFGEGFRIVFKSDAAGTYPAKLTSGSASWTLTATAEAEPPPAPSFVQVPDSLESGIQRAVSIVLASPAKADLTGTLRLEFQAESSALGDDAAVAFLPSASRSISFNVAAGLSEAKFLGEREAMFQTGSTAGWITLRIILGPHQLTHRIRIAPAPVKFVSPRAAKSANLAEVVVQGIDNVRATSRAGFRFLRSDGVVAGSYEVDLAELFFNYFRANPLQGGAFQLRAQFPITGDASQLESVEVSITNSQGVATTGLLRF
jgi:hypothetical protein